MIRITNPLDVSGGADIVKTASHAAVEYLSDYIVKKYKNNPDSDSTDLGVDVRVMMLLMEATEWTAFTHSNFDNKQYKVSHCFKTGSTEITEMRDDEMTEPFVSQSLKIIEQCVKLGSPSKSEPVPFTYNEKVRRVLATDIMNEIISLVDEFNMIRHIDVEPYIDRIEDLYRCDHS